MNVDRYCPICGEFVMADQDAEEAVIGSGRFKKLQLFHAACFIKERNRRIEQWQNRDGNMNIRQPEPTT